MSKLLDQLSEIDKELEILCAGDEIRVVIEEFESTVDDLEPQCKALQQSLTERSALLEYPNEFQIDDIGESEEISKAHSRECFSALLSSWDENPANIRQNGSVAQFRDAVVVYQKSLTANNRRKWADWTDSLAKLFLIADAQIESVKHVPDYKGPIAAYRRKYEDFSTFASKMPTEAAIINQVRKLADELSKIRRNISFDLPPKILRFFEALDRDGRYPLSKLDPEIYEWLKENNGLKDLSISRRGYKSF